MIYDNLDKLISYLKTNMPQLKQVDYYRGEFESDTSEWNPVFPVALLNLSGFTKTEESISTVLAGDIIINVFAAIKFEDDSQRQILDRLITTLNSLFDFENMMLKLNTVQLHGYFFGIHIYRIELVTQIYLQ